MAKVTDNETIIVYFGRGVEDSLKKLSIALLREKLGRHLNIVIGKPINFTHDDGELAATVQENVRGKRVFFVNTTHGKNMTDTLLAIDALKRASAREINLIILYYGYSRQERKTKRGEGITAKLAAKMIECAGVSRVVSFCLHAGAIQGFFDVPSDNINVLNLFARLFTNFLSKNKEYKHFIVSPDIGGTKNAHDLAKLLSTNVGVINCDKVRKGDHEVEMRVFADVENIPKWETVLAALLDDIISTGTTISRCVTKLIHLGVSKTVIFATHAIFAKNAPQLLNDSGVDKIFVTDTIKTSLVLKKKIKNLVVVSVAPHLVEAIKAILLYGSISTIFEADLPVYITYPKPNYKVTKNGVELLEKMED